MSTIFRLLRALLALLPFWLVTFALARRGRRLKVIASLALHGGLHEDVSPRRTLGGGESRPLFSLLRLLRLAGAEASVRGVSLRIGNLSGGWAQLEELRQAIDELQRRGRTVFAYLDRPSHAELFLASACDHVTVAPMASLDVVGLRAEVSFFRDALAKAGVKPHFEAAGEYKTYAERFTRNGMSEEHRESLDLVLRGVHEGFVAAVSEGRDLSTERVQSLLNEGPYAPEEALEAGLIDAVAYPDEWRREMRRTLGDVVAEPEAPRDGQTPPAERHRLVDLSRWLRMNEWHRRLRRMVSPRKAVVVLPLEGGIVDGDGPYPPPGRIAPRPTSAILRALRRDDSVAAVVLRINSPGGSGLASDMMWHELKRLSRTKPLIASMGDYAASGGYYLAMAGDEVLADSLTITGSIGVVAGKFDISELLDRIGVSRDVLSYGANTGIQSFTQGWTEAERERLRSHIEGFYEVFVRKAAASRGVEPEELLPHAAGRVWTGEQALERGLIDGLGSTWDAVRRAAVAAKLGSDYEVWIAAQARPRLIDRLSKLPFARGLGVVSRLGAELGVDLDPAADPVQARMPFSLTIK